MNEQLPKIPFPRRTDKYVTLCGRVDTVFPKISLTTVVTYKYLCVTNLFSKEIVTTVKNRTNEGVPQCGLGTDDICWSNIYAPTDFVGVRKSLRFR